MRIRDWSSDVCSSDLQRAIADVAMLEDVMGIAVQRRERVAVAGIGQRIEIDDADAFTHGVQHVVATNETGAAGYQPGRHAVLRERTVIGREVLGDLRLGGTRHLATLRRAALRAITARAAAATGSEDPRVGKK